MEGRKLLTEAEFSILLFVLGIENPNGDEQGNT